MTGHENTILVREENRFWLSAQSAYAGSVAGMTNTTLTGMHDRAVTDRAELDRLLDDTVLAHIGMVDDTGSAVVIPTGIARDGDRILIHGSTGSGWLRRVAEGRQVCVTVTDLNGIIVARSSFESSFRYRSAVLFGTFTRLSDPDASPALDAIIDQSGLKFAPSL